MSLAKTSKYKKTVTLLSFFLFSTACFCEKFSFEISPRFGVSFGQVDEILYSSDDEICSLLQWEQNPLFDAGVSVNTEINNFCFLFAFDYSLPIPSGYMNDYDWEGNQIYSHSVHPINKIVNLNAETEFAYRWQLIPEFCIKPSLLLQYNFCSFESGNGECWRNNRHIKVYGIDYLRHSFFIFTGLCIEASLPANLYIKSDFYLSPFSFQYGYDYHHGVQHPFASEDYQNGCFSKFRINLAVGINISPKLSMEMYSRFLFGNADKGDFYSTYYSGKMTWISDQKSGTGIYSIKTGLGLVYKI